MALIVDAGPVVALHDRRDPRHSQIAQLLRNEPEELVLTAEVSAEIDYLIGRRVGARSRRAFAVDLAAGRYVVDCMQPQDYRRIVELGRRYADLSPGLADLSMVVVADRRHSRRLATFDERHFRVLRPIDGGVFTILPADEALPPPPAAPP